MSIENERRILDEYCVGIVWQLGQPDYFEARAAKCRFIGGMLRDGLRRIDRSAGQVGKLAFGEARADRPGESTRHQCASERTI